MFEQTVHKVIIKPNPESILALLHPPLASKMPIKFKIRKDVTIKMIPTLTILNTGIYK